LLRIICCNMNHGVIQLSWLGLRSELASAMAASLRAFLLARRLACLEVVDLISIELMLAP